MPSASQSGTFEYEVRLGRHGPEDLSVLEYEAEEALSTPYWAEITALVRQGVDLDAAALLGAEAVLTTHLGGERGTRFVHGIIARVDSWDTGGGPDRRRVVVRMVPRLWALGQTQRCRIFQGLSTPEIVAQVLGEGGVTARQGLSASYPARDYCVQYRESDLAFVSRLLEEEGIFYWFEHAQDSHVMVLADDVATCPRLTGEPRLPFREPGGTENADPHVDRFLSRLEVRPTSVSLREYDFQRPALDLTASSSSDGAVGLDVHDYPGRYEDPASGQTRSQVRLEELRVAAATASGTSTVRWLVPGTSFELADHPVPAFNGAYLTLSVKHRGLQPEVLANQPSGQVRRYENAFTCLPAGVPFRPARLTPTPLIHGAQTARVVGPAGEEIHTDAHGRIKVQFHWDREGKRDERSSCWVRVAQAWAGPGFGALYLPRIGHEVVVEFLEGNPDRPVVTGSVYNGENPPPIDLPMDKTKSTLRSASSPGANGFNELRLEDAAASEEVYLHAQRDFLIEVLNDKTQRVGGNERLEVTLDRTKTVRGNQRLRVEKDDTSAIGVDQRIVVARDRTTEVGGNHAERVALDQTVTIGGNAGLTVGMAAAEAVGLAKALSIGADYSVTVGGAMTEVVGGIRAEEVGADKVETIGGSRTENVEGARSLRVGEDLTERVGKCRTLLVGESMAINVGGAIQQTAGGELKVKAKTLTLAAEDQITLRAGSATIQLTKAGDVVVNGAKVNVTASGPVVLKGASVSEN